MRARLMVIIVVSVGLLMMVMTADWLDAWLFPIGRSRGSIPLEPTAEPRRCRASHARVLPASHILRAASAGIGRLPLDTAWVEPIEHAKDRFGRGLPRCLDVWQWHHFSLGVSLGGGQGRSGRCWFLTGACHCCRSTRMWSLISWVWSIRSLYFPGMAPLRAKINNLSE